MKTTKKALSVLLAVIMIMSSMSVCFGTFTFAANVGGDYSGYTTDPFSYLATHLSSQTITDIANSIDIGNGGKSGNANSTNAVSYTTNITLSTYEQFCEVRDILIYLDKAIKGSSPWGKTVNTQDSQSGACAGAEDIYNDVVKRIEKYETLTTQGKEFIKYVLDYSKARNHDNAEKITKSWGKWGTVSKTPSSHQTTVNISTSDYKGYLAEAGVYTNVDASIELGYTYNFYMRGDLYYSTTSWGFENARYYHNMVWVSSNPINAPSVNKSDTTTKTKLNTFVNTVDNTIAANSFDVMASMTLAQIEALEKKLDDAKTTVQTYVNNDGLDNYATLFPGYDDKIANFKTTAAKAKEIAKYSETVAEITAYQTNNPNYGVFNWGGFDETTIKADYAEFMGKYGSIINDATLYDYFVRQGKISDTYVKNFRDNVVAYNLDDLKEEKVLPLYDRYALSFPMEGGEDIPLNEKQAAYSELSGYINNIYSYTPQVQNAIFPTTLMNHILDLQEKLECQVADCVIYFAENVGKDYSDVSTEDVIAEIARAKNQLAALNTLRASIDYADNTTLLDGAFANADEFIAYLYSLLADRFTAQVNTAEEAYNALKRPTALDLSAFSKLNVYLSAIEENILTFIDGEGKGALITAETRAIYAALKAEVFPAFDAFLVDRGFNEYETEDLLIRREDNPDEIFRENENLDDDILGEYEVTEANVEKIITTLEAALKDPAIAQLLGNLINKDEDGNPTGEAFDLAALLNGLIEGIYSDDLINTIISFIYPAVANIFTDVWAGINPVINDPKMNVMDQEVAVYAVLDLFTVEQATAGLGVPLFPKELAAKIRSSYPAFLSVADVLDDATTKSNVALDADGKPVESTRKSPWNDEVLYTAKLNEDGTPVINEETGETTMVLNLDWGIDELEGNAKRERFLDAAQAALCGLEPLLLAILCHKEMNAFNSLIGTGEGELDNFYVDALGGINLWDIALDIYQIDLRLEATANDGYNNVIAPLFEMLNVTAPNGRNFTSVRQVLKDGLFDPLDAFIAKLDANPLKTILDLLPNLAYAAEADLLLTKLNYLGTTIKYSAGAYIDADVNVAKTDYWLPVTEFIDRISGIVSSLVGLPMENGVIKGVRLDDVVGGEMPVEISSFLDINALLGDGVDLSSFAGIWNLVAGLVPMLADVPAPDAAYLATLGKLVEIDTVRSKKAYTGGTAGKAYHIQANRADVLQYLVKWVLESGLLNGLVEEPSELIAGIFENLQNNPSNAVAAIVELLTQQTIYDAKNFTWFDGTIDGENVLGNSATAIYLNPNNDWTEEKAEYLYNNIDALVASILTMAKLDLNKETEEIDGSIGEVIGGAIDGLLSDKTLTSLAALLAGLDLNALLAGDAEDETATVAEGEEAAAPALDVTALINDLLGIDLSVFTAENSVYTTVAAELEADPEYVHPFGVDAGTTTFAAALATLLAPLSKVLDFILAGEKLEITLGTEKVTLIGADGYNNGLIPLLEALGCDVTARADLDETSELEAVINALVARIDALTEGDVIKNIINLLPGVLYFITSNGLSTSVLNLLQPIVVIIDTIRPVINVMDLINNIEVGEEGAKQPLKEFLGGEIDLERLDVNFIFKLLPMLLPDLDLSGLKNVIYDVCKDLGSEYESESTLAGQTEWKKGAYSTTFRQADMLTVVLSFVLEWITIPENGAKLDEMFGTDGIVASIGKVFEDVKITYGTPNWMYWFDSEEAFNEYLANPSRINTLATIDWENIGDNDWDYETAKYFAENIDVLVDKIIAMINEGKTDEEGNALPTNLKDLLSGLVNGLVNAETLNDLVGMITGLLGDIDENLINAAGYLLDVDLAGLKNYTCTADIDSISDFINELANVLDKYAGGLVNWLFFGDDYRFAKKSDNTDTIVINGGLGYEKGLAMILEALGCELPAEANTKSVLGALATRIDYILKNDVDAEGKVTKSVVDKVLDLLPNLVYFLNANGAGVAVDNLLQPVYALLDKLSAFGLEVNLADLLKITKEDGTEIAIDLANLSLANVVEIVEGATDLPLDAAEAILVNFCTGKITKGTYIYKMEAAREDVITILLVVALELISDDAFPAKLDEMLGTDIIAKIKSVFAPSEITYETPDWNYAAADNGTVDAMKYAITYPNNWNEDTAEYVTDVLLSDDFDKLIAGLIEDGKYATISELLKDKVNVFTTENLEALLGLIEGFLGGIDESLLELGFILDVDLNGLMAYEVTEDINDVKAFAAELSTILGTYAPGVVEWLLLGRDFKLLVKDADGIGEGLEGDPYITISGAEGYKKGLAILLEALGCENLPSPVITEENTTAKIIEGVLTSLAARIDDILSNDVNENGKVTKTVISKVLELLPNLFYFLNTNGVAAVIKNTTAALTALSAKINVFVDVNLDVASMVDLKELLKLPKDAALSMENLSMAAVLEAVGMLVGLDLTKAENVLVDFALGKFEAYTSVSGDADAKKMVYADEFDKHDLVTVVANLALLVLADEANAEFVKGLVGKDVYDVILNVLQIKEAELKKMSWQHTDKVGESFNAMTSSENYKGYGYGPRYTEEMADYIAENIGEFVDNIIYLLGIEIEGESVESLKEILKNLVNGNLYNSANIVAIRDALAGLLDKIAGLEVNSVVVGGYIVDVLKTSLGVDVTAVAEVEVPEFTEDKAQFITYLGNVVEPLGPILNWILTDEDIAFFAKEGEDGKPTYFIKLPGNAGYKNGIVLLLEALGCENIVAPADLEGASGSAIVTAIAEPLLNRLDEIINNPAEELLAVLPNLIYFINSNGVDVVVKNTLNAVYTILNAIEPIAKIDLYELIGLDLETLTFEKLIDMLLKDLEIAGFKFTEIPMDTFVELTVGKLETYDSLSAEKPAYRMVYDENSASKGDMVTVLLRLVITFILTENNREVLINLLKSELGMSADAEKYVAALFKALADCTIGNQLGMDSALATIYYVYYGLDKGVGETADGKKDLDKAWQAKLKELGYSDNKDEQSVGNLITDILDIVFNDQGNVPDDGGNDVLDKDGLASNGFLSFFQRIKIFFEEIAAFFRELFSFGK